jgi:hypothetical protein
LRAEPTEREAEEIRLYGIDCPKRNESLGKGAKGLALVWSSAGFRFEEGEPVTVDRSGRTAPLFCFVMRNLNSEPVSMNVYIWSDLWRPMLSEWHNMW